MLELRGYQRDFFQRVRERYDSGVNRQLGVLATGLGKAVLFAALREQMNFTKKIMVLVHREELANQAADKFQKWNPDLMVGVEKAERTSNPMDTFIVASVPTLGRRGSKRILKFHRDEFDCLVSDEAHHSTAPQWRNVLEYFGVLRPGESQMLSLGLTATPNRSDGTGLRQNFDEIVFDMGIRSGIEAGWLVDLRGIRISTKTNLDKVHSRAGDFAEDELANAVNTVERNAIIVKEWMRVAYGLKTVVFTVDIQHALDLAATFQKCSIEAEAVWGDDPERARKLQRHRSNELKVICNCAVLTEGYDDPGIKCIVLAKPTKSALLFTQMIGRGTRIDDGKESCLIVDVVDATSKHSLVTMPSLLGMPANLDLKGKSVIAAKEQFERVAREFPTADLSDILSLSKLESVAQELDLFHVRYPEEISKLSELAWRKNLDGYVIAPNRESIVKIAEDLRGDWWIRGRIGQATIETLAQNLPGAMNIADAFILGHGISRTLMLRNAPWKMRSPSEKTRRMAEIMGIEVPAGITQGELNNRLDAKRYKIASQSSVAYARKLGLNVSEGDLQSWVSGEIDRRKAENAAQMREKA